MATDSLDEVPAVSGTDAGVHVLNPQELLERLLPGLRGRREGLSACESEGRLLVHGRNELVRRGTSHWSRELGKQFIHPLVLLLWLAAGPALVTGTVPLSIAIVAVIVFNALFAFCQERHAERAVEALSAYLPVQARVLRGGEEVPVDATILVPGSDPSTGQIHFVWQQATTMSFLGIAACQVGTAMAARTQTDSLRRIGVTTHRLLLGGLVFELVFIAAVVGIAPFQLVFGTAVQEPWQLLLLPFPFLVLGAMKCSSSSAASGPALRRHLRRGPCPCPVTVDGRSLGEGGSIVMYRWAGAGRDVRARLAVAVMVLVWGAVAVAMVLHLRDGYAGPGGTAPRPPPTPGRTEEMALELPSMPALSVSVIATATRTARKVTGIRKAAG